MKAHGKHHLTVTQNTEREIRILHLVGSAIVKYGFIGKRFSVRELLVVISIELHFEYYVIPGGVILNTPKHRGGTVEKLPCWRSALIACALISGCVIRPKRSNERIGHIIACAQLTPAHARSKVKIIDALAGNKIFTAK